MQAILKEDQLKLEPSVATGCVDGSTPTVWYVYAYVYVPPPVGYCWINVARPALRSTPCSGKGRKTLLHVGQLYGTVWYGKIKLELSVATGCVGGSTPMVWYGMVWYRIVWYRIVWYRIVW